MPDFGLEQASPWRIKLSDQIWVTATVSLVDINIALIKMMLELNLLSDTSACLVVLSLSTRLIFHLKDITLYSQLTFLTQCNVLPFERIQKDLKSTLIFFSGFSTYQASQPS